MSFVAALGKIFSAGASSLVDAVGDALDKNITSDEERLKIEQAIQGKMVEMQQSVIKANEVEQQELTKRWQADTQSDSWLAKNVRPLTVVFLTVMVTLIAAATIFDSESINIAVLSTWTDLFTVILLTVYAAYFGSRGLEKVSSTLGSRLSKSTLVKGD